ncbi:hypothetical protein BJ170DRAFT_475346 [Xylariales sp. AK1849]|nr:hypothetical protein BJ170DRAFT_475346 [Xylariales sp. AK1849]
MGALVELPVELAYQVLEELIIDDVFSLRLVCRSFHAFVHALVDEVAYKIARNTFPKARLLLMPNDDGVYDFAWLRTLMPHRLAAIALDHNSKRPYDKRPSHISRIQAEDDFGDSLRKELSGAWCLLQRIGEIYEKVYDLPLEDVSRVQTSTPWQIPSGDYDRSVVATVSAREARVYEEVLLMVRSLSPQQCQAFFMLAYVVFASFDSQRCPEWRWKLREGTYQEGDPLHFFDCREAYSNKRTARLYGHRRCFDRGSRYMIQSNVSEKTRHPDQGNSWICWWFFREGAASFWKQWGLGALRPAEDGLRGYSSQRMQELWAQRSEGQACVERESAGCIWYALMARSKAAPDKQEPLTPLDGYDSLLNPWNESFPVINKMYTLRKESKHPSADKTMIAWYLWQKGTLGLKDNFEVADWLSQEEIEELHDKFKFDSVADVPYLIKL